MDILKGIDSDLENIIKKYDIEKYLVKDEDDFRRDIDYTTRNIVAAGGDIIRKGD